MATVKSTEVVEQDIFQNTVDSAKLLTVTLDALQSEVEELIKLNAKLAGQNPLASYDDIKKVEKNISDFAKAEKELLEIRKLKIAADKELNKLKQEAAATSKAAEKLKQEEIKTSKDLEKLKQEEIKTSKETDKFKQEGIKTSKEAEKLKQEGIKTSKEAEKLKQEEIKTAKAAKKATEAETKAKKKNVKLTEEEIKEKIKAQKVNKEYNDTLQDTVVLEDKSIGTLKRITAQNRILRRERDNLNLATKEGQDRLVKLNEAIDSNNAVITVSGDAYKKQKLNIGNYISENEGLSAILSKLDEISGGLASRFIGLSEKTEDSGKKAEKTGGRFKKLSKVLKNSLIGVIAAAVGLMAKSFTSSREGAVSLQIKLEQMSNTATTVGTALIQWFKNVGSRAGVFIDQIKVTFNELKINAIEVQQFFGIAAGGVADLTARNAELNKSIADQKKTISETAGAFEGLGDRIGTVNSNTGEFLRNQIKVSDEIVILSQEISKLTQEEELLQAVADDGTKTLLENTQAQTEALKVAEARFKIQREIAELQLDQAILAVQNELLAQGKEQDRQQIRSLEFLEDRDIALKAGQESVDALSEALFNLNELEKESAINAYNAGRTKQEIARDVFERELDLAIDLFDNQKTINERKITDEGKTLAEKQALLDRTKLLEQNSFENQVKLVEDYTNRKLELSELVKLDDEEEIRRRLKIQEFDGTTADRILGIIKERKTAQQDLLDLDKDIADEVQRVYTSERELEAFRLEVAIAKTEEAIAEEKNGAKRLELLKQLQDEQIKLIEYQRDTQLSELNLLETEKQKIIEESEEKIRQLKLKSQERQTADKKKSDEEQAKSTAESVEKGVQILEALAQSQFEKRNAILDKNIEASAERISQLEAAASESAESVTDNLAFEEKKQAELQAQKEKELQKQKQAELGLAALKVYSAKVAAGDPNALGSTFADVEAIKAFVKALPAFYEGTNEKTVSEVLGAPDFAGRDGYVVRVDGSETILNPQETREYHAQLEHGIEPRSSVVLNDTRLVERLRSIESAIHNQFVYKGRDYSATENAVIDTIESRNKTIRNHVKKGGLFGS